MLRREWKVSDKTSVFLNVASIMATKAQLPLVQAFAALLRRRRNVRLVLLGTVMDKSYRREVEKAIDTLGIADKVIFAGYHRDSAPYYHAVDVFVLPSYWEGWSLSLGEAMANSLSCVITNVGAAYEFAGHPGVEVIDPPFGDITELNYRNLGRFIYEEHPHFNDNLAAAMLRAAGNKRRFINTDLAKRFDRQRAYARYTDLFMEFIDR